MSDKEDKKCDSDLEDLLDDAFNDFSHPQPPCSANARVPEMEQGIPGSIPETQIWTEEFIQEATRNFEATMRAVMEKQQGLQADAPGDVSTAGKSVTETSEPAAMNWNAMAAEFSKFAESASKSSESVQNDDSFVGCLSETMRQLNQNSEQLQAAPTADDLGRMFENMGLAGGGDEADAGGAMGALFPLMQTMLENILSKEVLYQPIKEITTKYPDWLADNRNSLSDMDYDRYNKQYDIMKQVVQCYESATTEADSEAKSQQFDQVMTLMQKLQDLGQPPKDLVGDMECTIPGTGGMSELNSLFGGIPSMMGETPPAGIGQLTSPDQCCLM